jgi:hypothetical protein
MHAGTIKQKGREKRHVTERKKRKGGRKESNKGEEGAVLPIPWPRRHGVCVCVHLRTALGAHGPT